MSVFSRNRTIALFLVASVARPVASRAQEAPISLKSGVTIVTAIEDRYPRLAFLKGRRFRLFQFDADSGVRYDIRATSRDFAPALAILRQVGQVSDYLDASNNRERDSIAIIRFRSDVTARLLVLATSIPDTADSADTGRFTIQMRVSPDYPVVINPIQVGGSAEASFTSTSPIWSNTDSPYAIYTFAATSGQRVGVRMQTAAAGADVEVGTMNGNDFVRIGAADSNSPIKYFVAPRDGVYAVKVMANEQAGYVLRLTEHPVRRSRAISPGSLIRDTLEKDAEAVGKPSHEWVFSWKAGDRLVAKLTSDDFDPYLILRKPKRGEARDSLTDDDGGDGLNSRIAMTAEVSGEYVLRVRSADSVGGAYSLTLGSAPSTIEHRLRRAPIQIGKQVTDSLRDNDVLLHDGSAYTEWLYDHRGSTDTITVTMTSTDFDTFLSVGHMENGKFVEWSSNDDASGDGAADDRSTPTWVSRVRIIASGNRTFVIRANSTAADQRGAYSLKLETSREARFTR